MTQHTFEQLVDLGVWNPAGTDDDGEPLVWLDEDKALEHAPEIYWHQKNVLDEAILDAIDEGLMDWELDPDTLEEVLIVTEKGMLV